MVLVVSSGLSSLSFNFLTQLMISVVSREYGYVYKENQGYCIHMWRHMLIESQCLGSLLRLYTKPCLKNKQKVLSGLVWFENKPFLFSFRFPQDGTLCGYWQCRSNSKGVGVPLIESRLVLPPFFSSGCTLMIPWLPHLSSV